MKDEITFKRALTDGIVFCSFCQQVILPGAEFLVQEGKEETIMCESCLKEIKEHGTS